VSRVAVDFRDIYIFWMEHAYHPNSITLVRNSGVYVFPRGPVGGFSGVYFPDRTPGEQKD
jgi:hypothetical protein